MPYMVEMIQQINALDDFIVQKSIQQLRESEKSKMGDQGELTGWVYFVEVSDAQNQEQVQEIARRSGAVSGWTASKRVKSGTLIMQYMEGGWNELKEARQEIARRGKTQTWKLHSIRKRVCPDWDMRYVGSMDG